MNWATKLDQQKNTLLLTFYMFIAMTLVVIRSGLIARSAAGSFPVALPEDDGMFAPALPQNAAAPDCRPPPSSLDDYLDRLYADALALLYAAELIARRLASLSREIFELMNQSDALAQSLRGQTGGASGQSPWRAKRLDAP